MRATRCWCITRHNHHCYALTHLLCSCTMLRAPPWPSRTLPSSAHWATATASGGSGPHGTARSSAPTHYSYHTCSHLVLCTQLLLPLATLMPAQAHLAPAFTMPAQPPVQLQPPIAITAT